MTTIDITDKSTASVISVKFERRETKFEGDTKPEESSMTYREAPKYYAPDFNRATGRACSHINTEIDEALAEVTCRDCGVKLNPIWVLARMAKTETKWGYERQRIIDMRKALDERVRCKCDHCGKMTNIRVK